MQIRFATWAVCALALAACSSKATVLDTCVGDDPRCGVACNSMHPCATGLHCGGDQLCTKACDATHACPGTQRCTSDGRCEASTPNPMARAMDAGTHTAPNLLDNPTPLRDAGNSLREGGQTPPGTCQQADVSATRVIPTVVLVIDQSGSMTEKFGSGTRWDVLRDFLLKPDGLIASFEGQVRFGLAMYSARAAQDGKPEECPIVTGVSPMIGNFKAISDVYGKAQPIDDTPTGDAIDAIVAALPKKAPDQANEPVALILATDGEPDRCEELNPQNGQAEAITAVENAFKTGIRTFIISVGDEVSTKHQQDVANAGIGHKAGEPNAPYWNAGDDASLRAALTELIAGQVSCDVTLKGKVQSGNHCDGRVLLNNHELVCKDKDGWDLIDPSHIRLLGKACNDFKTQQAALVHATFPCSVDVIF